MKKLMARLLFCLVPAMAIGLLCLVFDKHLAIAGFLFMLGLGWQVTAPVSGRGE